MVGLTAAVALWASSTACGPSVDKAGGETRQDPLVLQVLNTRGDVDVQPFLDRLAEVSGGALELRVEHNWERGSPSADADAIDAVRVGAADLGIVPARAWHEAGVRSFDALIAPLAVDSMALQQAVLAGDLPTDMLAGLTALDLEGLGILPGVMRRPAGITRPLLGPTDYADATIGFSPSAVADYALRALGARPVTSGFEGTDVSAFDGLELQASGVAGNEYDGVVRSITENVRLWPRPLVVFGSAAAMRQLSEQQRGWLRAAARESVETTTRTLMRRETEDIQPMCRRGRLEFTAATPEQLAELRAAFQPVYDWLGQDEQTRRLLDEIAALRADGVTPFVQERLSCSDTPGPGGSAAPVSPFDGTYEMTSTVQDGDSTPENWGDWIYVFTRGRFAFTQENAQACTWGYGTFTVTGGQVEWTFIDGGGIAPTGADNKPGEFFVFGWSSYRDTIVLSEVPGAISPHNFFAQPWHRVSDDPQPALMSSRCPPPADALPA